MSATEEVDGLGVARPHYGCECGAAARGRAGLAASVEAPFPGAGGAGGAGRRGASRTRKNRRCGDEGAAPGRREHPGGPRLSPGAAAGGATRRLAPPSPPETGEAAWVRWQEDGAGRVPRPGPGSAGASWGPRVRPCPALRESLQPLEGAQFPRQDFKSKNK